MIANITEFEKRLIDLGLSKNQIAEETSMHINTLNKKLKRMGHSFTLSEAAQIAIITKMTNGEFMRIFFGE